LIQKDFKQLPELIEGNFASALLINHFKSFLKLLAVGVSCSCKDLIKLHERKSIAVISVELRENRFNFLKLHEFGPINGGQDEFRVADGVVAVLVGHLEECLHLLFVKIGSVKLLIAMNQLFLRKNAIA
jgi:hypothetical protein